VQIISFLSEATSRKSGRCSSILNNIFARAEEMLFLVSRSLLFLWPLFLIDQLLQRAIISCQVARLEEFEGECSFFFKVSSHILSFFPPCL